MSNSLASSSLVSNVSVSPPPPTDAPIEPLFPTKAPVEPPTDAPTRPPNPCKPDPCDPGCECIVVDGMAECICPPPPTKAPIEPVTPTDAPVRTPTRY